jgi:type II secretory pathway pseudopilin PulG
MHIVAKKQRSITSTGFTIVETLIVLVIAGLFLLIIFEALPALGRSSRNDQRRQDVQAILEAVSQYELNHSGNFPYCGYSTYTTCYGNNNLLQYAQLTYYTSPSQGATVSYTNPGHITAAGQVAVIVQQNTLSGQPYYAINLPPLPGQVSSLQGVYVYNYEKCVVDSNGGMTGGATIQGAGYSDVVALYAIETGSTSIAPECQQL